MQVKGESNGESVQMIDQDKDNHDMENTEMMMMMMMMMMISDHNHDDDHGAVRMINKTIQQLQSQR